MNDSTNFVNKIKFVKSVVKLEIIQNLHQRLILYVVTIYNNRASQVLVLCVFISLIDTGSENDSCAKLINLNKKLKICIRKVLKVLKVGLKVIFVLKVLS